jgi:RNA polymerase sigma-70 factor (ECF subfamily)
MDPDQDLVDGLKRREMGSLHGIYQRHGARVQVLCRRLLGRAADAEDATQDVFLKLFERIAAFDGRARFATWLHRFAVNLCLQRLERERLRRAVSLSAHDGELHDPNVSPSASLERTEAAVTLERLLARLSSEHRAVLVLRELEGLSYREIAAALAVPEGTVMSRLARARAELVRLASLTPRIAPRTTPRPILESP